MANNPISDVIESTGMPALIDTTRSFLEKLLGPAIEETGELLRDSVRSYRWQNQHRILEKAHRFALTSSRPVSAVPLRTLVPLLEAASLEDEPELQSLWAALLANASTTPLGPASRPAFVDVLKQLSPVEAQILSTWYVRYGLPMSREVVVPLLAESLTDRCAMDASDVRLGAASLVRLGLISTEVDLNGKLRRLGEAVDSTSDGVGGISSALGFDAPRGRSTPVVISRAARRSSTLLWELKRRDRVAYGLTPLGIHFLLSVLPPLNRPIEEPWDGESDQRTLADWRVFAMRLSDDLGPESDLGDELRASARRTVNELARRRREKQTGSK